VTDPDVVKTCMRRPAVIWSEGHHLCNFLNIPAASVKQCGRRARFYAG